MTRAALFTRYQHLADRFGRSFFLSGADEDDVVQEARIALWEATGKWDHTRGVPFPAFAQDVMRRRLSDAITAANRLKHQMLTDAVRTADSRTGPQTIFDFISSSELTTEELVLQLEELRGLVGAILGLSELERKAIVRVINGLGPECKQDDNALHRARRKLKEMA